MSFSIAVRVSDGTATVTTGGDVPDGYFEVAGHEDDASRQLSITRRGADGRYVQSASAIHHKEP